MIDLLFSVPWEFWTALSTAVGVLCGVWIKSYYGNRNTESINDTNQLIAALERASTERTETLNIQKEMIKIQTEVQLELNRQLDALREKVSDQAEKIHELTSKNIQAESKIARLEEELHSCESNHDKQKEKLESQKLEIAELKKVLDVLRETGILPNRRVSPDPSADSSQS